MANFCSGVKVRLFGGAAGSMSSSVTSSFWARSIKGVELVKVMVSVLPVSPWREERLRQVSHVSLTDRVPRHAPDAFDQRVPIAHCANNNVEDRDPQRGKWLQTDGRPSRSPRFVGNPPRGVDRTGQVLATRPGCVAGAGKGQIMSAGRELCVPKTSSVMCHSVLRAMRW